MTELADVRRDYARSIAAAVSVSDAAVIEAFASVPREDFLGPGPWLLRTGSGYEDTRTSDPAVLYADVLVALDADKGINNGQPSLHALSIAQALPRPGDRVIHIGAGTGYYTAILAHIVGPEGRVVAYEVEPGLAQRAAENLQRWPGVTVVPASATGVPLPDADVIYVSAGVSGIPMTWLDALAVSGRLVFPMMPIGGVGHMWRIWRVDADRYAARVFSTAVFIGCVGAQDRRASDALRAALMSSDPSIVRSLRRGTPPDTTAWLIGDGWWLSTTDP